MRQLQTQLIGAIATVVYTAVVTYIILKVVDLITGLRASKSEEQQGLDITSHEETGYDF